MESRSYESLEEEKSSHCGVRDLWAPWKPIYLRFEITSLKESTINLVIEEFLIWWHREWVHLRLGLCPKNRTEGEGSRRQNPSRARMRLWTGVVQIMRKGVSAG